MTCVILYLYATSLITLTVGRLSLSFKINLSTSNSFESSCHCSIYPDFSASNSSYGSWSTVNTYSGQSVICANLCPRRSSVHHLDHNTHKLKYFHPYDLLHWARNRHLF